MDKFGKWLDGQGIGGNLNTHTKWGSFNEYRMLVSEQVVAKLNLLFTLRFVKFC